MNYMQLIFQMINIGKNSVKRVLHWDHDDINPKRIKSFFNPTDLRNFSNLLETEIVECFLRNDYNFVLADNYLIAITCIYFFRAELPSHCYDTRHFLSALYLAHEIEEDWVLLRREIVPWFPVAKYESNYAEMLKIKNNIWNRMNYECFVTKDMCDQLMKETPGWNVWKRIRSMPEYMKMIIRRRKQSVDNFIDTELNTSDWEYDQDFLYLEEDEEN